MRTPLFVILVAACSSQAAKAPAPTPPTPPVSTPPVSTPPTAPARTSVYLDDIDASAKPCDDFYQYANGAWRAANPIPASMDRWSRRWQAGETNKTRLTEILEDVSKKTDWPAKSIEQQIGDFYATCMDEHAIDAAGAKPLDATLAQIDAIKTPADVQKVLRSLADDGLGLPFFVYSSPDVHDPRQTIADLAAGGLGMPDRDYYSKKEPRFVEARDKYRAHVQKMFALLGRSAKDAKKASDTVFAFESRLAAATLDNIARRDPTNSDHPTEFDALAKLAPHVEWAAYFDGAKLPHAKLNVDEPAFMKAVDKELAKTPVADWKIYLTWQVLNASAPWLSKPFADEAFDFDQRYLGGVAEMKPRGMRCAELTDQVLGEALGQKYVEKYFPPAAKARAKELVMNELAAMKDIINELTWMSDATKQKALAKLATFNPKIGYPDKWKDYSSVVISRASFFDNLIAGRRFVVADDRAQIGKPTDRGRWGMTPPTSDAYYNPLLNEIVFPAGILQPPAFDANATDAVDYGAIGVVIGHEISHGFDDQGAQFDGDGRLSNWWTPEDLKAFQKRGQCVVDQFEGYFIEPGIHHQGKLVLGESIGDLGGVKIAFRAFEKAHAAHPEAPPAGMTPEQEFFVAWGQFRGDQTRPETQRRMVQGDPHPIAKFRVLGPLSNFQPFAQAFSCGESSPMVRPAAQRCEVW
ncbi:MAG TPA: M13 family metallopeptidase [Kofleriaceae bacterium]|nr:M13 family metallopeptidase [Kofleriaceae bacterium]